MYLSGLRRHHYFIRYRCWIKTKTVKDANNARRVVLLMSTSTQPHHFPNRVLQRHTSPWRGRVSRPRAPSRPYRVHDFLFTLAAAAMAVVAPPQALQSPPRPLATGSSPLSLSLPWFVLKFLWETECPMWARLRAWRPTSSPSSPSQSWC